MFYQLLFASNDAHGQARRLYVTYSETGILTKVYEARAHGRPDFLSQAIQLPNIHMTPSDYKIWKLKAKTDGIYEPLP